MNNSERKVLLLAKAEYELIAGKRAVAIGNEGKARVCARRAVSFAIEAILHASDMKDRYGTNVISRLEALAKEDNLSDAARNCAKKLREKISELDNIITGKDAIECATMIFREIKIQLN